jgi:lipoprotein-anchoring transpeptidase ErfK/SrfK
VRPLSLTGAERRACPVTASACADLKGHLAWLQSGRKVTYGPVRMEPGSPGTPDATPRGTFHVSWKAGPHFVSDEYGDPMPWATFFAPGGIAFHGGSLTQASHGCVHLTTAEARYFQSHLPLGAEVVVF